jgi:IclR family transcriptional regulator, acetate operon repressor
LETVAAATGETVHLSVLRGSQMWFIDRDEHTEGISAAGIAGAGAGGHVIAISVPAPSERFLAEEPTIVAALRDAAASKVWR